MDSIQPDPRASGWDAFGVFVAAMAVDLPATYFIAVSPIKTPATSMVMPTMADFLFAVLFAWALSVLIGLPSFPLPSPGLLDGSG